MVLALRDRETRENESGRLVRKEQRGEMMESEGWEKMVEEEESAMAKGLKLEVTIEEAIAEEEEWERDRDKEGQDSAREETIVRYQKLISFKK